MENAGIFNIGSGDLVLGALAHDVEFALERIFVSVTVRAAKCPASHKYLLYVRLRPARDAADGRRETRRVAPSKDSHPLFPDDAF